MKFVRSDAPEVAGYTTSARARASRGWYTLRSVCTVNALGAAIVSALGFGVSMRAASWLSVPVFLALNGYVFSRIISAHREWVIAAYAGRVYIRVLAQRHVEAGGDLTGPDAVVFETSDIALMWVRSVEVYLYGPKPRIVEWLVIEPAKAVAEDIFRHIRPLLGQIDPENAVLEIDEEGRLTIVWKWWRPALRVFLQAIVRECPSVVIGREEHSELDLNGIWTWSSMNLTALGRQRLVQAVRLGFGCKCAGLLRRYKSISLQEAKAYLAQIEREETGEEPSCYSAGASRD